MLVNAENLKALAMKASLLRRSGPLDFRIMAELFLLTPSEQDLGNFVGALDGDIQTLLDVAFDMAWCGSQKDAFVLLDACVREARWNHPMLWYTLSWLASFLGRKDQASD